MKKSDNYLVYQPAEDSYLLHSIIKKYAKGKSVLDMGSGTGILAQESLKSKAKSVLAIDINPKSINLLEKQNISCIKSDLFTNIKEKFDLIIFNPPYLPLNKKEDPESRISTTGGKTGNEIIIEFLKQSKHYLTKKGIILILISSLTPQKQIISLIKKQKKNYKIITEKKIFFESLEVWKIYNRR